MIVIKFFELFRKQSDRDILNKILQRINSLERKQEDFLLTIKNHVTMERQKLAAALNEAADQFDKGKQEILDKIAAGDTLTPEEEAAVARIKALAQSFDDVVPDQPATEETTDGE